MSFRKVFNPTLTEKQELYDRVNDIVRSIHDKHGDCCSICKHLTSVQANMLYDYSGCKLDPAIEFGYGMGSEKHICDKYEFRGYLHV